MSVRINPADRVVVTNFNYRPGQNISIFSLTDVNGTANSTVNNAVLTWNANTGQFQATELDLSGGIYNGIGSLGGQTLQIRYSDVWTVPPSLEKSELAFSFLQDSYSSNTNSWAGGKTLYIGDSNGNPIAIGSSRIYEAFNHEDGIVLPNSALVTDANSAIDQLTIGNVHVTDSRIEVTNPGSSLYLEPGAFGHVSTTGHRVVDVQDPVDPQDAVTLNYLRNQYTSNLNISVDGVSDSIGLKNQLLNFNSSNTVSITYDVNTNAFSFESLVTANALVVVSNTAPLSPTTGTAWYDQDGTGRTYVWDGLQWVDLAPSSNAVQQSNTVITISNTAPASPWVGMPWYCTANTSGFIWNGTQWVLFTDPDRHTPHSIVSPTPPLFPANGDIWIDSSIDNHPYVWNSMQWIDIYPDHVQSANALIVIANTAPVNADIGTAWFDQDGTGRTYIYDGQQWVDIAPQPQPLSYANALIQISNTEPYSPEVGTAWYDSGITNRTYIYSGTQWLDASPSVQTPHSIVSNTAPLQPANGDIWVDSNNDNHPYAWNGSTWLDIIPPVTPTAPITVADNPPVNPLVGAAWYDRDNTGRTYVWDGTQWVDTSPAATPPNTANAVVIVSNTAPNSPPTGLVWYDSNSTSTSIWTGSQWSPVHSHTPPVVISNTAPTTVEAGDLWYDQDDTGRTYVWDGSQWVDVAPNLNANSGIQSAIVVAASPPTAPLVGTAWYDEDTTGRTYVWDGSQWVDASPPSTGDKPTYTIIASEDLTLLSASSYTVTVPVTSKAITIQIENYESANTIPATAGWKVYGVTQAGRNVALGEIVVGSFEYPIDSSLRVLNYVDNGSFGPSQYLNNKYKEYLSSITITSVNSNDVFITGNLTIWSET